MSNVACCDLNSKGDNLKLQDMCRNPKYKSQKQITFTPGQFQLEVDGFRNKLRKIFRGTKKAWDSFLQPALTKASPYNGMAVGAKTINA